MAATKNYHYRVLIVEDDYSNHQIIANCLKDAYKVEVAEDIKSAMALIQQQHFHIMLLDIGLPDGSGRDICRELKANHEQYGEVNIIFITGKDRPDDEVEGLRLGASDYISKPFNVAVVKARVDLQAQLIRKTELLANLARIDGLTEIANRRAFDDHLEKSWNHAKRISAPLSLALLDIDFFKQYNDIYGHPAGDECLRSLAHCLKDNVKRGSDHVARYGGEEFAVILFDCDNEQAQTVMNNLLQQFSDLAIPHAASTAADFTTFSCGVCTVLPEMGEKQAFLEAADKLLYQAKSSGRAKVLGDYLHKMDGS